MIKKYKAIKTSQSKSWLRCILTLLLIITSVWPAYLDPNYAGLAFASQNQSQPAKTKRPEIEPGQLLVKLKTTTQSASVQQTLAKPAYQHLNISRIKLENPQTNLYQLYLPPTTDLDKLLKLLRTEPEVEYAEPNYIYHLAKLPSVKTNDPGRPNQYYLDTINIPAAWSITTGTGLVVAVEDSGVRLDHPDLVGRIRTDGYNFVADNGNVSDDLGHGTEVSGIIAANSNNKLGISGISWGAQILPVKVADAQGFLDVSNAAAGIYYGVQHGAKILNLSYGGETSSATLNEAINYALYNHVIVVASAGNAPDGAPEYPAAYTGVIAVAATDLSDKLAFFNSYGSYVSLSAPGVSIYTTGLNKNNSGDYGLHSGTSFSAPVVSGVVALLLSVNPYLRPSQVLDILQQTADKIYPSGLDYYSNYGAGRVNAYKALQAALQLPIVPFVLAPARVSFAQALNPNATIKAGEMLTLTVRAVNFGQSKATAVYINIPLDPRLSLQYVQMQPNIATEWVSGVFTDHFKVDLGGLEAASSITFTAILKVSEAAQVGDILSWRGTGFWSDAGSGGSHQSNTVSVTVDTESSNHGWDWLHILEASPASAKIGQDINLASSDFAPGEQVALWLNLPDGTTQALPQIQADSQGRVIYLFSSNAQTQIGSYSLVAHGLASQIESIARFNLG
jgi:subtilisin family serine protease